MKKFRGSKCPVCVPCTGMPYHGEAKVELGLLASFRAMGVQMRHHLTASPEQLVMHYSERDLTRREHPSMSQCEITVLLNLKNSL